MKLRVLILGGRGMLGHKLVQVLGGDPQLEVHCTVRRLPPSPFVLPEATYHPGVEIAPGSSRLAAVLRTLRPDVVVNAVGAIKQKELHAHLEETFFVNGTLPHLIPFLNPSEGARLIHFSTDCVFRGDRGGYRESDTPDVFDLYGRSKACGEVDYANHLTLRTSIIGFELASHLGLLSWFLRQPRGSTLSGYEYAIFSGLPTVTLSRTVLEIVKHHPELRGLYHVASEPISKLELLGRINHRFDLRHELAPSDAVRIDRSLDDSRFRAATGTVRPRWHELVQELAADYRSLPYESVYDLPLPAIIAPEPTSRSPAGP